MKKLNKLIRENIIFVVIGVIVLIGLGIIFIVRLHNNIPDNVTFVGHKDEEQFIYSLKNTDTIEQSFSSPHEFDFITIDFSDHEQKISGNTFFIVTNMDNGKTVAKKTVKNEDIHYGQSVRIILDEQGKAYTDYKVNISFSGMGDLGLGIFGFRTENTESIACNLSSEYIVAVGTHSFTNLYYIIVTCAILIIMFTVLWIIYITAKKNISCEKRFLSLVIPVGLFFLVFFNYNRVHDGNVHLAVTEHFVNVLLLREDDSFPRSMSIKEDFSDMISTEYNKYNIENDLQTELYYCIENFKSNNNRDWIRTNDFWVTTNYSPIEYLPAIVTVYVGRVFNFSSALSVFLARVSMFALYVCCCYYAINITQVKKQSIMYICLIPMNIYQATGITYDSIVVVTSVILYVLFIKANTGVLTKKERILIYILCMCLGACKGGLYLLIPLIFICIPRTFNGSSTNKRKIITGGIVAGFFGILPCLINVISPYVRSINTDMEGYVNMINDGVKVYAFRDIVMNPIEVTKIIINSNSHNVDKMLGQMFGNRMAWTDLSTSWSIIVPIIMITLFGALCIDPEEITLKIPVGSRVCILIFVTIEIVMISIVMLISEFTPIGSQNINGVQGRYFLPWLPFLMLVFHNNQISISNLGKRMLFFGGGMLLIIYECSFLCIYMGVD